MRRLLPRSLLGQTVLLLLIGLIGSHLVSMLMYADDRVAVLAQVGGRHVTERVAEITRLFEEAPPEWRPRLLKATDSPSLVVTLSAQAQTAPRSDGGWMAELMRRRLALSLGIEQSRIMVEMLDHRDPGPTRVMAQSSAGWLPPHMGQMMEGWPVGQTLRASLQLQDGEWLNFTTPILPAEPFWSSRAILSMMLMALGVVVLSALAARRLIAPLQHFAAAAERLGKDVTADPLPESGPVEIRSASIAFNRMQQRLRRLVENRTRLLAAISHDLRTPITLLKLRTDFIADEAERAKAMATLDEMEAMIAGILAFARDDAEAEKRRRVDLAALVSSLCDDMADAGQPVTCAVPDKLSYECSPGVLKRAVVNLVENAVRYGGRAGVRLDARPTVVILSIEDDGPGIPEAEFAQVFQPFYRLEGSRNRDTGGVGLGMATAQAVVHAHGGEIHLSNRPEGGLLVTVELPR
ncbi:MAG: ATP-binding protein [Azospirillaceae bacterium]|nr:ATP-binding protein [Azospirillaceae bacterium]